MNRLHPATMIVAFLPKLYEAFKQVLPFLAISFVSGKGDRSELFIAAIGALGGFGAIAAYLTTRYGIQDGQLICTSGWLFRRDRRIPLDQIQNVNIRQGVLERLLKVATVEIETAAGHGAELKLQVVTEHIAEEFRRELSLVSGHKVEAEVEKQAEPGVIYRMNTQDLILGAMTENQGGQVVFALIGTVGAAALVQAVHKISEIKYYAPSWLWWVGGFVAVIAIMALGWLYGGIQYAVKNAHFTVRPEPGMFRISHGLLTKIQHTVRLKRVEVAIVSTTLWQRLVKRCSVRVGTAGSFGEDGATAPIAMMLPQSNVSATLSSILPQFNEGALEWKPLPKFYLWVSLFRSLLTLTVIAVIIETFFYLGVGKAMPQLRVAIPAILAALYVWIWIDQVIAYRRAAYGISDDLLAVRKGFFRQTTTYMPITRIDTVGTSAPVWWSKRGVTTLVANAMVHNLPIAMLTEEDAEKVQRMIVIRDTPA
jgi:putative membrane protein